ncbi:MAG: HAD-IB family hydrolase [Actinomycetota bacterium]
MTEAAFFDLDKTVIARSSTLMFGKPLYREGMIRRGTVIKGAYAAIMYQLIGADEQKMERMRTALLDLTRGWDAEKVSQLARETLAEMIEPIIYAEAAELIRKHVQAGRRVYIVSSSGEEIVRPLAEFLGVPHAIGSRPAIRDGRYTGELDFYCQGEGKREAILAEAQEHGIDLEHSYAYSDSFTDVPMLSLVGNPVVVNPDKDLRKHAEENGWQVLSFRHPMPLRKRFSERVNRPASRKAWVAGSTAIVLLVVGIARRSRRRAA